MKTCTLCGEPKPLTEFHKSPTHRGGYNTRCKSCRGAQQKARYKPRKNRSRLKRHADLAAAGIKRCPKCGTLKLLDDFYRKATSKSGVGSYCKSCNDARAVQYARENRERLNQYMKEWRAGNSDSVKESNARTLERLKSRTPEQVAEDRARLRPDGTKQCYRCKGTVSVSEYSPNIAKADGLSGECLACERARLRARLRSKLQENEMVKAGVVDLFRCIYCGCDLTEDTLTVDHIIPRARGGTDDPINLVPACGSCNSSKWANPVSEDWLQTRRS